jgi:hypothetical protein
MILFKIMLALVFCLTAIPFAYPADDDICGNYDRTIIMIGSIYKAYLQTDKHFLGVNPFGCTDQGQTIRVS